MNFTLEVSQDAAVHPVHTALSGFPFTNQTIEILLEYLQVVEKSHNS